MTDFVTTSTRSRIADLKAVIETTVPPLADCSAGYALLDFPDYSNVGDSLIWLGELAYFEAHSDRKPGYVCTTSGFDAARLSAAVPEGPIFLSGGGNFGDLWPRFQNFRYAVMAAFPGRRIVQLPQTIHFDSADELERTRAAIRTHGNFALLVRDQKSFDLARAAFDCEVTLCPDMAFCMGPLAAPPPQHDFVALLRSDKERAADTQVPPVPRGVDGLVADWIRPGHRAGIVERATAKLDRLVRPGDDYRRFAARATAERARGIALLGAGRTVVTDRLHGHILGLLLGRRQIVIDNRYGKISGFARAWTDGVEGIDHVASVEEAFALAAGQGR